MKLYYGFSIFFLVQKMIGKIGVAVMVGIVGWIYKAIRPPLPKKLNSVCSNRVKLRDGRYLAYRETGVSKQEALYKIIIIHGFNSSKDLNLPISQVRFLFMAVWLVSEMMMKINCTVYLLYCS